LTAVLSAGCWIKP